jgi:hypothetical protein
MRREFFLVAMSVGLIALAATSSAADRSAPTVTVMPSSGWCSLSTGDPLKEARRQMEEHGDIACAREILLSPEGAKSAPMTFLLAATYDPNMLAVWRIRGAGNIEEAKALYEKARDLGHPQAQLRLDWLLDN